MIDAGDDATCEPVDQRGVERPKDGDGDLVAACDLGAVELVPEPAGRALAPAALAALAALAGGGRRAVG